MKDALLAFVRGFVAAGVATAIPFLLTNLSAPFDKLAFGAAIAFLTGAIAFVGAFLRDATPEPFGKAAATKRPSKLDWLPF